MWIMGNLVYPAIFKFRLEPKMLFLVV